jgi:hypothetical protein
VDTATITSLMIFLAQQMKLPKALNHKVVANLDAEI